MKSTGDRGTEPADGAGGASLALVGGGAGTRATDLAAVARQACQTLSGVRMETDTASAFGVEPALVVRGPEVGTAIWGAVPAEHLAAPFLEHLRAVAAGEGPPSWFPGDGMGGRELELLLFVGVGCPHCPQMARLALGLVRANAHTTLAIFDVGAHDAEAQRYKVQSVPCLVVDGGLSITGVPRAGELAALLAERGTPAWEGRVLASLLETGRLSEATERLRNQPALLGPVWQRSGTSLRMGLMLAAQRCLAEDPRCLDVALPDLASSATVNDAALRGDTADLLGQIGSADTRGVLEKLAGDTNPDVAEIARDALAMLDS